MPRGGEKGGKGEAAEGSGCLPTATISNGWRNLSCALRAAPASPRGVSLTSGSSMPRVVSRQSKESSGARAF